MNRTQEQIGEHEAFKKLNELVAIEASTAELVKFCESAADTFGDDWEIETTTMILRYKDGAVYIKNVVGSEYHSNYFEIDCPHIIRHSADSYTQYQRPATIQYETYWRVVKP